MKQEKRFYDIVEMIRELMYIYIYLIWYAQMDDAMTAKTVHGM